MIPVERIIGRTGNQMYVYAFLLAYAQEHGITDSYFPQDPVWFENVADKVRLIYSEGIGKDDRVGIHVRRTDYLDPNRIQYGLPLSYYEEAMTHFPNEKFVVCSDDIEWCKQQPVFKDCDFSKGTEIEDMNLLASCKGVIMANSTFSWWGAWLNPHNPKVVMPYKWDKEGKYFPAPDNWIRI